MSFFDQEQFDASKIEPSNFDALPPGDYTCLIEKMEEKKRKGYLNKSATLSAPHRMQDHH